jgi:tetratricopeptide (TPR) repeat protein/CHAT domain-containing protein
MFDQWQTLNKQVINLYSQGNITEAIPIAEQVLTIAREIFPNPNNDLAASLNNSALLYISQGKITDAELLYREALEIRHLLFCDTANNDLAASLNNLAELYTSQKRWAEAEPLYREALKIRYLLFDNTPNRDLAASLNSLAELYVSQGKIAEAEPLHQEALEICHQLFGNTPNNDRATSLDNLAALYVSQGKIAEAEPLHREALEIRRQLFGNTLNNHLATSLNNLAELYISQGRWAEAEPWHREALEIRRQLFGNTPNNDLATSVNNLASLYTSQGRFKEAEPLHREALKICRHLFGDVVNDSLANNLNNLATLYAFQGRLEEAEPLYKEVLKIHYQLFGDTTNNNLANSLNNLAELYRHQRRLEEAEPLYLKALNIRRQLFEDRGHSDLLLSYQNYATLLVQKGEFIKAGQHLASATKVGIQVLADFFQGQTEQGRLSYRDRQQYSIDCLLSCLWQYLAGDSQAISQAFEVIYLWKSIATAVEIALSAAIFRSDDPDLQQIATECQQLRRQLNQITQNLPSDNIETYRQEISNLQTQLIELEKAIAAKVPQYELMETTVDRQAINLLVPAGDTLVDFVRFNLHDLVNIKKGEPHYLAFVLTHEGLDGIKLVKLGTAAEIDGLIAKFRQVASDLPGFGAMGAVTGSQQRDPARLLSPYQTHAIDLRRAIIDPLNIPENQTRAIFAPDGDLNLVPLGILPLDNGIVSDRWSVRYISASRDLRPRVQPPAPASVGTIVANPNYDFPARPIAQNSRQELISLRTTEIQKSGSISTFGDKLTPLPQTEPLAQKIAQSLGINLHLGNDAHAANLRHLRSPQYLIVATHGLHGLDLAGGDNPDPMRDAGLALTGYNTNLAGVKLPTELERGLFTARDLLELDLWGSQIAILLACSTGTGLFRQGEGIFGLKRALAIAGVPTLIVSLWDVPVQASILLMDKFFEYYREGAGKPAPIALQQAQAEICNITREELEQTEQGRIILAEIDRNITHLAGAERPLQHPMFWGAWICQGWDSPPLTR